MYISSSCERKRSTCRGEGANHREAFREGGHHLTREEEVDLQRGEDGAEGEREQR